MYICIYVYMYICIYVYISTNYFARCFALQKIPRGTLNFCECPRAVWRFSVGISNTIEEVSCKMSKVHCFTVQVGLPVRAARICQPYRGFPHVGRCGPQTVRSGQKIYGKTRHFRSGVCSFPEREAGSILARANAIEEVRHRIADWSEIYVRSRTSVFGIANPIGEARPRIA